jgi:hypothetical protein
MKSGLNFYTADTFLLEKFYFDKVANLFTFRGAVYMHASMYVVHVPLQFFYKAKMVKQPHYRPRQTLRGPGG